MKKLFIPILFPLFLFSFDTYEKKDIKIGETLSISSLKSTLSNDYKILELDKTISSKHCNKIWEKGKSNKKDEESFKEACRAQVNNSIELSNLYKLIFLNNSDLKNIVFENYEIESLNVLSNLTIYHKIINNKKLSIEDLKNNSFSVNIKNIKSKNSEFLIFSKFMEDLLKNMGKNKEIEIELLRNTIFLFKKLNEEFSKKESLAQVSIKFFKKNIDKIEYSLNINIKNDSREYNINISFSLNNEEEIKKILNSNATIPMLTGLSIIKNIDIKSFSILTDTPSLKQNHNDLFSKNKDYRDVYSYLMKYIKILSKNLDSNKFESSVNSFLINFVSMNNAQNEISITPKKEFKENLLFNFIISEYNGIAINKNDYENLINNYDYKNRKSNDK